jgi:hypothetical protein
MSFFKSLTWIPLTEPAVPTGIKTGVAIGPCAVWRVPVLASESVAIISGVYFIGKLRLQR